MDEFADACKIAIAAMYPEALRLIEKGAPTTPRCPVCSRASEGVCPRCVERRKARRRK